MNGNKTPNEENKVNFVVNVYENEGRKIINKVQRRQAMYRSIESGL